MRHSFGNPQRWNTSFLVFGVLLANVFLIARFSIGSPKQVQTASADSATSGRFVDVTQHLGIHFQHQASHTSRKYFPETMGSGVALFDNDNDGRLDIFFVNGAPLNDPTQKGNCPPNRD